MKRSFKNTRINTKAFLGLLSLFFLSFNLQAQHPAKQGVIAVVSSVKGQAFYSANGKTLPLRAGTHISSGTEIFTELGGQVSLNDYYDHVYHLSGSGHISVYKNLVEIKEGYLWVQALAHDPMLGEFIISTANAQAAYTTGEAILSFDNYSGKTQILVVKGAFQFKNALQEFMNTAVSEGQFSFIQNEHNNGSPRRPTPIGYGSYKKVTGLFDGVNPIGKQKERVVHRPAPMVKVPKADFTVPKRDLASVPSTNKADPAFEAALKRAMKKEVPPPKKAPKDEGAEAIQTANPNSGITVLRQNSPEEKAEREEKLLNYWQNKMAVMTKPKPKKRWKPTYGSKSKVMVNVFGSNKSEVKKRVIKRVPASVIKPKVKKAIKKSRGPASVGAMLPTVKQSTFESKLVDKYKKQMRHDQEVNDLINELKSVDMDYKKEY